MEELVYRHNCITRATHWVNALALMILFMSGLMIFNAHPNLYWGSTSEPEKAFFSISAVNQNGELRGYVQLYGQQINTTGFLGVQEGVLGLSERAFPSWLTVPGYYSLASSRRWHFFFGWLFTLNGLLYVLYNLAVGHLRKFLFTPTDAAKVPAMIAYYLHMRKQSPQEGEYNPLQKLAYTSVFVILTPLVLLSGMAMSPQLNVAFNWLPAMFGGRQSARTIHFILAFGFLAFTFGHVFMVLTQGVLNNMRSMTTGWYRERFAPSNDEPKPQAKNELKSEELGPTAQKQEIEIEPIAATPPQLKDDETVGFPPTENTPAPPADSSVEERKEEKDVETKP
jgi:Ni/Fe-hydrogenase b-type cytochrome subunit